ncbi:hypothetical protein [Kitasatospora sp. NPDC058190]|uniref:hypothetical protein n=1 Tax=Kitasatospora sp. NPDC058190 TaxID=3346371 RepID=UPI0036DE3FAB
MSRNAYPDAFHRLHPGITETVLRRTHDANGADLRRWSREQAGGSLEIHPHE